MKQAIALWALRALFPKSVFEGQRLVVLDLRQTGSQADLQVDPLSLLSAPLLLIRQGHPSQRLAPLAHALGSKKVRINHCSSDCSKSNDANTGNKQ